MIVGTVDNAKTWHLPKELLTRSSPFFAAALNGSFTEANSKVVTLPEDDIDAFALFTQWLYVGEIGGSPKDCDLDHDHDSPLHCCASTVQTLIQAWVLGDKLGCAIFKDLAMLGLIDELNVNRIEPYNVGTACERSAPGSKLRRVFLDQLR